MHLVNFPLSNIMGLKVEVPCAIRNSTMGTEKRIQSPVIETSADSVNVLSKNLDYQASLHKVLQSNLARKSLTSCETKLN